MSRLILLALLVVGAAVGLGGGTLLYAEGTSYLSSDPAACVNCHVMRDVYESWTHGPHRHVASCVDCHLPHDGLAKWVAKASNGFAHSTAFTFRDDWDPIRLKPHNAAILQERCLACHGDMAHLVAGAGFPADEPISCVHCHKGVGHGGRR